jgi:hypothetical protein
VPSAALTVLAVSVGQFLGGLLCVGIFSTFLVVVVHEQGMRTPSWWTPPGVMLWSGSLFGWLATVPEVGLTLVITTLATSPVVVGGVRACRNARLRDRPLRELTEWDLETLWSASELELERADGHPAASLCVVLRRAELLDELFSRHDPGPSGRVRQPR